MCRSLWSFSKSGKDILLNTRETVCTMIPTMRETQAFWWAEKSIFISMMDESETIMFPWSPCFLWNCARNFCTMLQGLHSLGKVLIAELEFWTMKRIFCTGCVPQENLQRENDSYNDVFRYSAEQYPVIWLAVVSVVCLRRDLMCGSLFFLHCLFKRENVSRLAVWL